MWQWGMRKGLGQLNRHVLPVRRRVGWFFGGLGCLHRATAQGISGFRRLVLVLRNLAFVGAGVRVCRRLSAQGYAFVGVWVQPFPPGELLGLQQPFPTNWL